MNPKESLADRWFLKIRLRMLKENRNWLAVVCGETGSGKSYSAMQIADTICPRGLIVKRHVLFSPKIFLKRIAEKELLRRGDVLIFDEAGVGLSSRQWYSLQNKLLGAVLQTFRHLNVGVIFTVPNLSFVDVQARKLFHAYLETHHVDYEENLAYLKVYEIQHNSRLDKTYYKHPKFYDEQGRLVKVKLIGVPKISDKVAETYEMMKSNYTHRLNVNALAEVMGDKKVKEPSMSDAEAVSKLTEQHERFLRVKGERMYLDQDLVMEALKLPFHRARRIKKVVEDKLGIGLATKGSDVK